MLLDAALEDNAAISQAALAVIDGLQGTAIDGLVAERLPRAQAARAGWSSSNWPGGGISRRRRPTLWKAADDADPEVRAAALTALGGTIQFAELPQLIARLRTAPDGDEAAAIAKALQQASQRMPDREGCAEKLAAALADAPGGAQVQAAGGPRRRWAARRRWPPLPTRPGRATKRSATRPSACWANGCRSMRPRCCSNLAKSAKEEKYQVRAVRGYIRLARQFVMPQADRAAMCRTALEIAQRPDDKRLVLEILLRYPSPEMLALALEAAKVAGVEGRGRDGGVGIGRSKGGDSVELRKALAQAGHKPVKLEILKAEYGEGAQMKDVTAMLRRHARNYRVIFLPSASYNETFGGDPAPGVVKHLKVRYRINGKEGEATLTENATVVLPMPR